MSSAQKFFMSTFAVITVISIILTAYSVYLFFGSYKVLHVIEVSIESIKIVEGLNPNRVSIQTILLFQNPSEFALRVAYISEKLYLNNQEVGETYKAMYSNAIQLPSNSNGTVIVTMGDVPLYKVSDESPRMWFAVIRIVLFDVPVLSQAHITRYPTWPS